MHVSRQAPNSAQTALNKLAAKPGEDSQQLAHKVVNILERYRVQDFFHSKISSTPELQQHFIQLPRHVRRGRPSKNSQTESVTSICLQLQIQQVDEAIKKAETLAFLAIVCH
ncbi:MAG: hypothetical protein SAK29_13600 [Scytonema sp. PMC 1069.18]|nr:hypothetical protein [Scytonema sp. PMC 1069.18]MEC4887385.1 hypothetical protein [Scytonema sp. PMC 1070.18]